MGTNVKKRTLTNVKYQTAGKQFNAFLKTVSDGLPVREFQPLRSWPVAAHPRQEEIDKFDALPSLYARAQP